MMRFLTDVVAFFAPDMILEPWPPPLALEPEALDTFFEPCASCVTRAAAAEAIVRGTIFLLSFADLADEISVSYDHFR
jgi:hypothetical protein